MLLHMCGLRRCIVSLRMFSTFMDELKKFMEPRVLPWDPSICIDTFLLRRLPCRLFQCPPECLTGILSCGGALENTNAGTLRHSANFESIYTKVSRLVAPGEFFKGHPTRQNFRQTPSRGWRGDEAASLRGLSHLKHPSPGFKGNNKKQR